MVQSPELASVHNIRPGTGRVSAHRERHYAVLREKGPQPERGAAEAQEYTRGESVVGNVTIISAKIARVRILKKAISPDLKSTFPDKSDRSSFRSRIIEIVISSELNAPLRGFHPR